MSPRQTLVVAIRLLTLWLGISVLLSLMSESLVPISKLVELSHGEAPRLGTFFGTHVAVVAICIILWWLSGSVAGFLLHGIATDSDGPKCQDIWFAIAYTSLGLWILVNFIPVVVLEATVILWSPTSVNTLMIMGFGADILRVMMGATLILGWRFVLAITGYSRQAELIASRQA